MRTPRTGGSEIVTPERRRHRGSVDELAALWSDGADDPEDEIEQLLEGDSRARFASGTGTFNLRSAERVAVEADPRGDVPVSAVMARKVICARPDMDASDARRRMLERGVSGLPVVDTWGRAIGVVSKTDLVEHEVTSEGGRLTVDDIMTPLVFTLTQDASIARAAALMAYEGIHRIVIVDGSGHLIGLVTSLDVARWMGHAAGLPVGRFP